MTPRELAEQICATLRQHGHQAYLVGGCVRDLLLGREPADYDVCTDARPERVQELFPRSLAVGAKFGVILVVEGRQRRSKWPRFAPTSAIPMAAIRTAWSTRTRRRKMSGGAISPSMAC